MATISDFHGTLRLDAKLSQMMTGWKSILLKPVDPFFQKNGAGTGSPFSRSLARGMSLHIGLDFGRKEDAAPEDHGAAHSDTPAVVLTLNPDTARKTGP